jgi:hypothetical protein
MNKDKKVKKILAWQKVLTVLSIGILIVFLVLYFRNHKNEIIKNERLAPDAFLLKDPSFGLGGNYVREGSIGEPFYFGELVNRGWWRKRNDQDTLILASAVKENGDKNNKELKGGEKIILNILLKNPESYPLVNIKIHGSLKTLGANYYPTELLNDLFLITPNSFDLTGGREKKISFLYTIPENIPPGNYSLDVGAVDSSVSRRLEGSMLYANPRQWLPKLSRGSFIFSVLKGDKSFGLVSKDGGFDFEMINKENRFFIKNIQNIISYSQVTVRFKMFNNSQEAKNFNVRYDLINFFGGRFAGLDKDLNEIAERRSFAVKPRSTEEVSHEFNLDDYIERAQKTFKEKGFYGADNTFGGSSLQVLIEGEGRKYIVYFPIFLEYKGDVPCLIGTGINKFPIRKGETVDLFTGFFDLSLYEFFQDIQKKQSLANENNVSRIELLLKDKEGGEIGRAVYVGKIDGVIKGWRNKIKAPKDLDYLELEVSSYNSKGESKKTMKEIYDCKKIEGVVCLRDQFNRRVFWTLLGVTLFFPWLIMVKKIIVDKFKNKKEKKVNKEKQK